MTRRSTTGPAGGMIRRGAILTLMLAATTGAAAAQSRADSAWVAGNTALAAELYEAELSDGAPNQRALHRLALIRAWSERYDESLELFDRLLNIAPSNVEASLDRAEILSWRNDLAGSADAYTAIIREDRTNREARLGLARVLAWSGQLLAAERVYEQVLSGDPTDAEALAGHARMAGWDGRLAEAERRWRAALEHHPDDVVLLKGLGVTLRWGGRSEAAAEVLERAVALAPDDPEARSEYRLARLPTSPRIGPLLRYESDSDGNRMTTLYHDHSFWPSQNLSIDASGYARTAYSVPLRDRGESYGGVLELRARPGSGWELDVGGGANYSSVSARGVRPRWRVRAATPGRLPAQVWARVARQSLDETAALMRTGVEILETSAGLRGSFSGFRGEATVGLTSFEGSERNERVAGMIALSRRVGSGWDFGIVARALSFEKQLSDGYFSPNFYGLIETRIAWEDRIGNWHLQLHGYPGVQRVNQGGEMSASIRTRGSFGYEFGPGQVAWLHAGYATTGLTSFSTGGADYQYFHAALAVGWAF